MKTLRFTEKLDFSNHSIYVGIDVHKKNWGVCILGEQLEHKIFSQPPRPEILVNYLHNHFPNADYYSAYEAGFCGFWIDRELKRYGIDNLVVNPSDIPTTDKEKKQKNDKRDARKIAKELRSGNLKGIYVADKDILEDRLLIRTRQKLLSDIKRCKCRIKSHLNFFGVVIPPEMDKPYWSKAFRKWLRTNLFKGSGQVLIQAQLDELESIENQKKIIEKQIVVLAKEKYNEQVYLLRSIAGIGLLAAMTLIVELVDIKRFKTADQMHSFLGLIPNVYASGDIEKVRGITKRHITFLRSILVQAAWRSARLDPAMMLAYNKLSKTMKSNKAIIRIAKKLSNRVRYVLKKQLPYQNL